MAQQISRLWILLMAISVFASTVVVAEQRAVTPVTEWDADRTPKLIATGSGCVVHTFWGSIGASDQAVPLRKGYVFSHTNLETGELTWLLKTGVLYGTQRYPMNFVSRVVGLAHSDSHFMVVIFEASWQGWRHPLSISPGDGSYHFRVFSMAEGKEIYSWEFDDFLDQESVQAETLEAGVIQKKAHGLVIFDSLFAITEGGEVVRRDHIPNKSGTVETLD